MTEPRVRLHRPRVYYVFSQPLVVRNVVDDGTFEEAGTILDCSTERLTIEGAIANSGHPDIVFRSVCATITNIDELMIHECTVMHFACHGLNQGKGIAFETDHGETKELSVDELRRYLRVSQIGEEERIKIAVVSSCYSESSGKAFAETGAARHVIAMAKYIADQSSVDFTKSFYQSLFAGATVQEAFDRAKQVAELNDRQRLLSPGLFVLLPEHVDHHVRYFHPPPPPPPSPSRGLLRAPARSPLCFEPSVTVGGFVGRLLPMHAVYRHFVTAKRVVTVTGDAGIGKTALAERAATYLADRGKFDSVFFVPLDKMHMLAADGWGTDVHALAAYVAKHMHGAPLHPQPGGDASGGGGSSGGRPPVTAASASTTAAASASAAVGLDGVLAFLRGDPRAGPAPKVLFVLDGCDAFIASDGTNHQHQHQYPPTAQRAASDLSQLSSDSSSSRLTPPSPLPPPPPPSPSPLPVPAAGTVSPGLARLAEALLAAPATALLLTARTAPNWPDQRVVRVDQGLGNFDAATLLLKSLPCDVSGDLMGAVLRGQCAGWRFLAPLRGIPKAIKAFASTFRDHAAFEVSRSSDDDERYLRAEAAYLAAMGDASTGAPSTSSASAGAAGAAGTEGGLAQAYPLSTAYPPLPLAVAVAVPAGTEAAHLPAVAMSPGAPPETHAHLVGDGGAVAMAAAAAAAAAAQRRVDAARAAASLFLRSVPQEVPVPLRINGDVDPDPAHAATLQDDFDRHVTRWAELVAQQDRDRDDGSGNVSTNTNTSSASAGASASARGPRGATVTAVPWPALAEALDDLMNRALSAPSAPPGAPAPAASAAAGEAGGEAGLGRALSADDCAFLLDIIRRHDVAGSHLAPSAPLAPAAPASTAAGSGGGGGPPGVTLLGFKALLQWWLPVLRHLRVIRKEFLATMQPGTGRIGSNNNNRNNHGDHIGAPSLAMSAPPCIHGFVSSRRAEELLSAAAPGTFLVRFASGVAPSRPGQLAISYRRDTAAAGIDHTLVDFFADHGGLGPALALRSGVWTQYRTLSALLLAVPKLTILHPHTPKGDAFEHLY